MARILVIDDDAGVRRSVELRLRTAGFAVETAASGEQGLELALTGNFDVVLSDLKMPGLSGIDVLRRLRERGVKSAMIIMTAFGTIDTAVESMKNGAVDFIQKPFFRDELLTRIKAVTEPGSSDRCVPAPVLSEMPADPLAAIVGCSAAVARVKTLVRRAAGTDGTVLITGETGTGKELVARAIHSESRRRERSFVPLNCAALTESVLESELFGHARGAFTGAAEARAGLIEHADDGTFFLDEIGTLPGIVQAKLLRVLEAGEIRRIGENEHRRVDVRFVAATNTDLRAAVQAGDFREDLFYRLNVLPIHLPPLRERLDDVRALAEYFLRRFGGSSGVNRLSDSAWELLAGCRFPGNVRQLQHAIQRAVAVARGTTIEPGDLPEDLHDDAGPAGSRAGVAAARHAAERARLAAVLHRHHGDLGSAARVLGVSRTTLWRLMRKHELADGRRSAAGHV